MPARIRAVQRRRRFKQQQQHDLIRPYDVEGPWPEHHRHYLFDGFRDVHENYLDSDDIHGLYDQHGRDLEHGVRHEYLVDK